MILSRKLLTVLALWLGLTAAVQAQSPPVGLQPVYNSFTFVGRAADIAVTTLSQNRALSFVGQVAMVYNIGTATAYVLPSNSSTESVTTSSGFPVLAGSCTAVNISGQTYLAAIGTGATTLQIAVGWGYAGSCGGGGAGGGGGGGGAVFGPTTIGSPLSNPPVVLGGSQNGLSSGNVGVWKVDATGLGYVSCSNCSGTAAVDESTYSPSVSTFAPNGGFFQTTATNNPLSNLQQGLVQMTANRAFFVNPRNSSGVEIGTASMPIQVSLANTGANGTALLVAGNGGTFPVTGTFWPYTLGQQVNANSVPVVLTAAQLTTLTPPAAITNYALETGGNLAQVVTDFGAPGATACASDTASCNLNQQMQRLAQRLSTTITTLGSPFQAGGSVGISGTLPAFAATPTVNLGTLNGVALAANQPTNAAIASTTAGQSGTLLMGAATTASPSYTTAQTNPLSLTLAGALRVDASATTQPVSVASPITVAQATAANLNATVVGNGTFAVQLTGATNNINNISGTISLPTGAATAANQTAKTAPLNAATATATNSNVVGGQYLSTQPTMTNTQQAALLVSSRGELLISPGASGFPVTLSSTSITGSVTVVQPTAANLNITCANCSGSGASAVDEATFTPGSPTVFAPMGGFFQTTATNNPLTNLQGGWAQMTANRAVFMNLRSSSGTELGTSGNPIIVSIGSSSFPITVAAGAVASGAYVSGALASGAVVDITNLSTPIAPNTATATKGILIGGQYNSTQETLTTGQQGQFAMSSRGALYVATGADAFTIGLPSGAATSANQPTNAAQASTTSGQTGTLMLGAATTTAPSYTTAQTNPLSLTLAGALRVDASATTQPISIGASQVAVGAALDGWNVTEGSKADAVCGTATGTCSAMAIWKYIAQASQQSVPVTVNGTVTALTGLTPGTAQTGTIVALNSDLTSVNGTAIGAMANYGTSPGAVKAIGVNAFVTNTVTVTGTITTTPPSNASTNITQWSSVALGSPSNYGTPPGAVEVPGVNAFVTNTVATNSTYFNNVASTVLTRTANTTAYSANETVCQSTSSACTPLIISIANSAAGRGLINRISLLKSGSGTTNANFTIWLFSAAPTLTTPTQEDATAYTGPRAADMPNYIGNAVCSSPVATSDTTSQVWYDCTLSNPNTAGALDFQAVSGQVYIEALISVTGAYTPASAETFTVYASGIY
jgi:hypothetical protein